MKKHVVHLTSREIATVLHALRIFQDGVVQESAACDHFADEEMLTNAETDDLCERINCSPERSTR